MLKKKNLQKVSNNFSYFGFQMLLCLQHLHKSVLQKSQIAYIKALKLVKTSAVLRIL